MLASCRAQSQHCTFTLHQPASHEQRRHDVDGTRMKREVPDDIVD